MFVNIVNTMLVRVDYLELVNVAYLSVPVGFLFRQMYFFFLKTNTDVKKKKMYYRSFS